MYYLHLLDGSRCHRSTVVHVSEEPVAPQIPHIINGHPLIDTDGNPQYYNARWTLGPVESPTEAHALATVIAARYNYDVSGAEIATAAAATLGRIGGSRTSEAKSAAARANGKLGGRPRKEHD